ncbi:hypothetical protein [Acholeplasma equifetale]|uniref:hypothetical protein n=1 Tax=Acholeplasma equifetale TaxID=264634 RepID=UPI00138AB7AB|nr:hypothetical protein [Acholeplasma equifetale]
MDVYEIISTILQTLSIIGTFCAVVVALYLAIRSERPRVVINHGIYNQLVSGKETEEYFVIMITNVSSFPVQIVQNFVLFTGKKKREQAFNDKCFINTSWLHKLASNH